MVGCPMEGAGVCRHSSSRVIFRRHRPTPLPAGFTLLELLLVVSLISLMLFFAVPRFQNGLFADDSRRATILLKQTIERLKTRARAEQTDLALQVNLDTHHFWITDDSMNTEQRLEARRAATDLSDALFFEEVEFSEEEKAVNGEVGLHFYRDGYSDRARIHLVKNDGSPSTLVVEPFLSQVRVEEDDASFRQ